MIRYRTGTWRDKLRTLVTVTGSVFPRAGKIAIFSGALSLVVHWGKSEGHLVFLEKDVLINNSVWGGFVTLVVFLVVFRTSQSYNRFNDGASSTFKMRAEWFDACSSLVSFCRFSTAPREQVENFKHRLVRLFSIMHAVALGEIEDSCADTEMDIEAYKFELLDADGIDDESLLVIMTCDAKVELLFQWIQQTVVDNIKCGVLNIPPPILTRAFQEMANGMVAVNEAMRISCIPFPFPYAQTCDFLLFMVSFISPVITAQWTREIAWAFVFTFTQIFVLWCLNFIAEEIENPFGADENDLDGHGLQQEMNSQLVLLLRSSTARLPTLSERAVWNQPNWETKIEDCTASLVEVWTRIIFDRHNDACASSNFKKRGCHTRMTGAHHVDIALPETDEDETEGRAAAVTAFPSDRTSDRVIKGNSEGMALQSKSGSDSQDLTVLHSETHIMLPDSPTEAAVAAIKPAKRDTTHSVQSSATKATHGAKLNITIARSNRAACKKMKAPWSRRGSLIMKRSPRQSNLDADYKRLALGLANEDGDPQSSASVGRYAEESHVMTMLWTKLTKLKESAQSSPSMSRSGSKANLSRAASRATLSRGRTRDTSMSKANTGNLAHFTSEKFVPVHTKSDKSIGPPGAILPQPPRGSQPELVDPPPLPLHVHDLNDADEDDVKPV